MKPEQRYFVQLLRDYIHSVPSAEPEEALDWPLLAHYAERQDLCGIVYYQCRELKSIDTATLQRLHEGFFSDAYRAVAGEAAMTRVAASFDAAGIEYLPFKGEVLRCYYPNPELRTMGDRDILIRHADRESTDRILQELGYERSVDRQEVWVYQRHTVMFEIHDTMFYEYLANKVDYRGYFERVWDSAVPAGGRSFLPKPELHFLYLMAHTAKHISNYGMGFRAFLDMVFFCRCEGSLDWDYIRRELEQLGLYVFTLRCFGLCEAWFGASMPFACGSIEEELLTDTTEKVFRDGIFGNENQENTLGRSANEILHDGRPYALAAARLTLRHVFPPYEDLRLVKWYSWVDGRPWLMPAAWVYRWFFVLLHKPARGRERLGEAFQKKQINNRQTYLERWGL
jgi:hypothetical protein